MSRSARNIFSFAVICLFTVVCLYLYRSIDTRAVSGNLHEKKIASMQSKIDALRNMLSHNRDEIAALKQQVADVELKRKQEWDRQVEKENEVYDEKARAEKALEKKVEQLAGDANHKPIEEDRKRVIPEPRRGGKVGMVYDALHRTTTRLPPVQLPICKRRSNYSNAYGDVQMLDLYNVIDFENVDGGAWKQGWEITYDSHKVVEEKTLEVIVIPHSHCDPGWLKTFEEYYHSQAKNILNGMVNHLGEKQKDMRFIYAEMSFFEMWWREQTDEVKTKVKSLLTSGALEIVTGGWVMTDEANAHYFSIITELMEGHEFLRNHIGYTPTTHWSIDPFGLSPTLPYLLSASNISNAAVQRVHYSVKKYLAKNKQLEFMWRQLWGSHGKRDIRTHMFPFYSYDIPHSCGPDPSVCCQFDFARLPGGHYTCPWGKNPEKITPSNVAERAVVLCDQYRKKSQLYQTNVLLVPLGDDFRYDTDFEWENHYNNYKLLFEEMNKNKDCNIHARFGTLNDYFVELDRSLRADQKVLPVLSGDFFTYADRDDHYWSGYFTSRPFYKQMDRALVQQLRAAEIAFSLQSMKSEVSVSDEAFTRLVEARRALSLFQHHDGVTGTARDEVVVDYGKKMLNALAGVEKVLSEAVSSLINSEAISATSLLVDEYRLEQDSLPVRRSYKIGEFVVLLNTLSRSRDEPICIYVSSIKAAVRPLDNREIRQQISPIFRLNNRTLAAMDIYEVCFIDTLKPFGVSIYEVVESSVDSRPSFATISANAGVTVKEFKAEQIRGDTLTLKNSEVEATFSSLNGFLKSVTPNGHKEIDVEVKFVHYGVRSPGMIKNSGGDNLSGAYLFLPDGQAKEFRQRNSNFVVVDGPLMKRVYVVGPSELKILQVYSLPEGSPSVLITNEVDIRSTSNFELAMRLNTNIESGDDVFTDLNALQLIRRRRLLDKLPLQAHFYPMPSSAYIEDRSTRLSLLGAQALGVASLRSGQIEVMLDRRLNQDDGRGLSQGVLDNHRTMSHFRLLVEPLSHVDDDNAGRDMEERVGYHSLVGFAQSMEIHYPTVRMISRENLKSATFYGIPESLPCDIHVVNLRTVAGPTDYSGSGTASPLNEAALILHRPLTDCRSKLKLHSDCGLQENTVEPKKLFPSIRSVREASLTLLYEGKEVSTVTLQPQDVQTVKLSW